MSKSIISQLANLEPTTPEKATSEPNKSEAKSSESANSDVKAAVSDQEDTLSDQEKTSSEEDESEEDESEEDESEQTVLPLNSRSYPTVERYREDGQIAVIISEGYGAGWSTWHKLRRSVPLEAHLDEFIVFDKDVVKAILAQDRDEAVRICREKFKALGMGKKFKGSGKRGLTVQWIDEGVDFRVTEYDGYEGIGFREQIKWRTA